MQPAMPFSWFSLVSLTRITWQQWNLEVLTYLRILDFDTTIAPSVRRQSDLPLQLNAGFFQRGEVFLCRTAKLGTD